MAPDPEMLCALAAEVAEEAGALLVKGVDLVRETVETKTSLTDMVSEMDRAAEEHIVARIVEERPDDAILGEEGSDRAGTSGVRWVIDPLDGTTNYLYGFLTFGVSVGVEVDGVITAGAVRDPMHGETFTAIRGGGSWCNGRRLRLVGPPTLSTALVGTGFSYDADRRARQAQLLCRVLPNVRDIRRAGAAAVDLCWLGAGRIDAFYEQGLEPWDWAAGSLVAAEAGARIAIFHPPGDDPAGIHVGAPPHLFDPLLELLDLGALSEVDGDQPV